jgi:hypothetical protein
MLYGCEVHPATYARFPDNGVSAQSCGIRSRLICPGKRCFLGGVGSGEAIVTVLLLQSFYGDDASLKVPSTAGFVNPFKPGINLCISPPYGA